MGWDFCREWTTKAAVVRHLATSANWTCSGGKPAQVLAHKTSRSGVWLVLGNEGKPHSLICCLIERSGGSLGYKAMGTEMHPYYYDCPPEFVALVPVNGDTEWRKAYAWAQEQNAKDAAALAHNRQMLQVNKIITLGERYRSLCLRISSLKPLLGVSETGKTYRIPRGALVTATIA